MIAIIARPIPHRSDSPTPEHAPQSPVDRPENSVSRDENRTPPQRTFSQWEVTSSPRPSVHEKRLWLAALSGNEQQLKICLNAGIPVDAITQSGCTALHFAAHRGCTETASVLLTKKANINHQNKDGNTTLMLALINRHIELVQTLLSWFPELLVKNNDGKTAMDLGGTVGIYIDKDGGYSLDPAQYPDYSIPHHSSSSSQYV